MGPYAAHSTVLQKFWERYFAVYDALNEAPPYRRMVLQCAEFLEPTAGDRILDAGAGTGNITQVLAVPGANVIGIDFCEPALRQCREKVPTADFRVADLTQPLPFDDGVFDKAACSLVLHFLPPERQGFALAELCRVLRPGGRVAITVFGAGLNPVPVYTETLRELTRLHGLAFAARKAASYLISTIRIFYYQWRIRRGERTGAYQYFTERRFREALVEAGFEVRTIERTMANQCWIAAAVRVAAPHRTRSGLHREARNTAAAPAGRP